MFDHKTIDFFKKNVSFEKSTLNRGMIWRSMWDMVRDGFISTAAFVETAKNALVLEKND